MPIPARRLLAFTSWGLVFCAGLTSPGSVQAADEPGSGTPVRNAKQSDAGYEAPPTKGIPVEPLQAAEPVELDVVEAEDAEDVEQDGADQAAWAGTLEIYGFTPLRSQGTTTVNGRDADFDLDLGDILSVLDGAFYVRGSVERDRLGFLTDLSYVKLGDEAASTGPGGRVTGRAQVNFDQGIYDFALRYRFGDRETAVAEPGAYSLIPYLGVRVLDIKSNVKLQLQGTGPQQLTFERSGGFDRTWAQPLIGIRGSYFLTPRLRAFGRADIAGFGISGDEDLSGNAQLGLAYAVGNSTDLSLSWRYQGIRYDDGDKPNSGLSMDNNGIELGVKFFF